MHLTKKETQEFRRQLALLLKEKAVSCSTSRKETLLKLAETL